MYTFWCVSWKKLSISIDSLTLSSFCRNAVVIPQPPHAWRRLAQERWWNSSEGKAGGSTKARCKMWYAQFKNSWFCWQGPYKVNPFKDMLGYGGHELANSMSAKVRYCCLVHMPWFFFLLFLFLFVLIICTANLAPVCFCLLSICFLSLCRTLAVPHNKEVDLLTMLIILRACWSSLVCWSACACLHAAFCQVGRSCETLLCIGNYSGWRRGSLHPASVVKGIVSASCENL